MLKKLTYALLVLLLLLVILGWIGVGQFNSAWFKETPNYLTYSYEPKPISFQWATDTIGNHIEPHVAIIIPVRLGGLPHSFSFQFDTGASSTLLYGNTLQSLKDQGVEFPIIQKGEQTYVENLSFTLGGNSVQAKNIQVLQGYGRAVGQGDTTRTIKLGTLETDFLDQRISAIDFKNQLIQLYNEHPSWMASIADFYPFAFDGRRIMLPVTINGKTLELFYDSGCSAFGLITSKNRYDDYTDEDEPEINYEANRFGEALKVHHKNTGQMMKIGNTELNLERISYVDMYAKYQRFMTPFTRIGGWLGNKPFIDNTLIIDAQRQEFAVLQTAVPNEQ